MESLKQHSSLSPDISASMTQHQLPQCAALVFVVYLIFREKTSSVWQVFGHKTKYWTKPSDDLLVAPQEKSGNHQHLRLD